jgi:hypothetical protein
MASRRRRRRRVAGGNQKPGLRVPVEVSLTEVPMAPAFARPGLDAEIIRALKTMDDLVRDMRKGLRWPNQVTDEVSAVQRYLVYLSMLVDSAVSDITMSALIKNDIMVLAKLRMLIEFATKAAYYDDHPDYALYMTTIGDAKEVFGKLRDANNDQAAIKSAEKAVAEMERRFPAVAHLRRKSFDVLMVEYSDRDDYVWLYRAPSALLHGDPEGMHTVFERQPDGSEKPLLEFPLDHVNAMLVDAGTNSMFFCDHFIGRFQPENEGLKSRGKELYRRFLRLVLKHSYERDAAALEAVRKELAET